MFNLNSLKELVGHIYDELPHMPAPLRRDSMPTPETLGSKFLEAFGTTDEGHDLLFRYKLGLYQMHDLNENAIKLANQTSTRMSGVQQSLNEHWEAVCHLHDRLAELPALTKSLDDIHRQLGDLERFMAQTEVAMLSLEALDEKAVKEYQRQNPGSLMDVS
uniref:Biogenesis of lysosome-related organelles complex 1 subunit 5 n=1 Tax=Panagrellus redivivus TaxID=6233 RepID=A0A7E4ZVC9_PANRE